MNGQRGFILKERSASAAGSVHFGCSRWALLKAPENLTRKERLRLSRVAALNQRDHRDGILAAIDLGLSNGRMEGLNNKIGILKHRAYGFHSAAALIAMIFLCCTKITLPLPTWA